MSINHNRILVVCKSEREISQRDTATFLKDSWYAETELKLTFSTSNNKNNTWNSLIISNPGDITTPVNVERIVEGVDVTAQSIINAHDLHPSDQVIIHLATAKQAFVFELPPKDITDDIWELLDIFEAYLARELDGIVIAIDGIYDKNLQLISGS